MAAEGSAELSSVPRGAVSAGAVSAGDWADEAGFGG